MVLRTWNKQVFGRTETHIAKLEEQIKRLEESLQVSHSEDVELDLVVPRLNSRFGKKGRYNVFLNLLNNLGFIMGKLMPIFFVRSTEEDDKWLQI